MLEARIYKNQVENLNRYFKMSGARLLNTAKRAFKNAAKEFAKKVSVQARKTFKVSNNKIKQRIKKYVISDLKQKVFCGIYRTGLTNFKNPRQIKKGVSYTTISGRKTREHAFIAIMPEGGRIAVKRTGEYKRATKGRYRGQKRETLEKQFDVLDESVMEDILTENAQYFYKEFEKEYNKEVEKILKAG